jgi:hypothetical protein
MMDATYFVENVHAFCSNDVPGNARPVLNIVKCLITISKTLLNASLAQMPIVIVTDIT